MFMSMWNVILEDALADMMGWRERDQRRVVSHAHVEIVPQAGIQD